MRAYLGAIETAAYWLKTADPRAGVRRPWPKLAARLHRIAQDGRHRCGLPMTGGVPHVKNPDDSKRPSGADRAARGAGRRSLRRRRSPFRNPGPNVQRVETLLRSWNRANGSRLRLGGSLGRVALYSNGKRVTRLMNPSDMCRALGRNSLRGIEKTRGKANPCPEHSRWYYIQRAGMNPGERAPVIYSRIVEIRAEKMRGKARGLYRHPFKAKAPVVGLKDGSLLIPAPRGVRLWG